MASIIQYIVTEMTQTLRAILALSFGLIFLSLTACSGLVEKPESEWTADDFYNHAKEAFDGQQWETAIDYFEKLKAYYPYGKYAEQSYLSLAYAYYKFDEPKSAIRELEEFIRVYPKHKALPYAYYLRALAADSINKSWFDAYITDPAKRDMKSTQQAYQYYAELLKRFPVSPYSAEARRRLIALMNRLARHEYFVAKFYYDHQAYLAAASHAQEVVQNYPRSLVNLKSLKLLAQSYGQMKMKKNAEDTWKVYRYNLKQAEKTPRIVENQPSNNQGALAETQAPLPQTVVQ
jgi:outer membrane protein assembly factor BamD